MKFWQFFVRLFEIVFIITSLLIVLNTIMTITLVWSFQRMIEWEELKVSRLHSNPDLEQARCRTSTV